VAITVGELVAVPSHGTRVLAGHSGLDRRVAWAHVCELPDPWRWMGEGELLMTTGIGVPADAPDQVAYVAALAAAGVVGIAIGAQMRSPDLHPAMSAKADEVGLPLLLTRSEVPFVALARAVAGANEKESQARLATTERLYHHMRSLAGMDQTPQLLRALGAELKAQLFVVSADGSGSTFPDAAASERGALVGRLLASQPGPSSAVTRLDGGAVAVRLAGPRPATLVAVPTTGRIVDVGLLQHAAAVVSAQRSAAAAGRERARRLGATLLARMLDGKIDPTVALDELADRGLGGNRLVAVSPGSDSDEHWADLHHRFDDAGVPHLLLARGNLRTALLSDDDEGLQLLLDALLVTAPVGLSDPFERVADTPEALRQATWSLHQVRGTSRRVERYSDARDSIGFLPGTRAASEQAARRILGPLLAYDDAKQTQLVHSLRVFLEENRSWVRAASRLHLHKQTLVYRMERVEQLTSRRLNSTADVADLWMALQAAIAAGLHEL
jgi:purine catabolism regulator